jgi:two-component system cell cycle response regulator
MAGAITDMNVLTIDAASDERFPVLVAEDNPVSRKLLEKALHKAGYEVVSVENGRAALDYLVKRFCPIVLTDWMMPEMDGPDLCRAIRRSEFQGYVFVILLTAKDSKNDIIEGLEAGADDYLTKPFNPAELMARLNTGKRILELERSLRKANEEIRQLSITDPLTGSYNRGYLNNHLPQELKRTLRYGRSLSLILCDIDHFKRVNDTYGHQVGDMVLRAFSRRLMGSIRRDLDWVARYGGEEFLIVLPETDLSGASLVGERIRKVIEGIQIDLRGKLIRVTASFGVTSIGSIDTKAENLCDDLIKRADDMLYLAKSEGRNRVKVDPDADPASTNIYPSLTLSPKT